MSCPSPSAALLLAQVLKEIRPSFVPRVPITRTNAEACWSGFTRALQQTYLPLFHQLSYSPGIFQEPFFMGGILQDVGSGFSFCKPRKKLLQVQGELLQQSVSFFQSSLSIIHSAKEQMRRCNSQISGAPGEPHEKSKAKGTKLYL